ncbi:hypothetical protein D9611_011963 [Ephemerocybe angulata]|uniref:Uncharacterized protein n=1 Tax=Ephemerocybe angulata TaxID=980116 RepID=A0A8H5FFB9_9AGAR|nr:hypothetical protein D9611_011963 [Tulosesus angulatus]
MPPRKRARRTATAVMAGAFDQPLNRDVLTSLLNGIGPYKAVELDAEEKKQKKKERKEARRQARAAQAEAEASTSTARPPTTVTLPPTLPAPAPVQAAVTTTTAPPTIHIKPLKPSFWKSKPDPAPKARPEIMIASTQRSVSVTPPPMMSLQPTPESTPGPSISSATSHDSLKRLYTPDDYEDIDARHVGSLSAPHPRERRKRPAAKKGWKGWVEGSPPPSEKLINLDAVPILQERRTRSGKNFDAIGVGKEGWV